MRTSLFLALFSLIVFTSFGYEVRANEVFGYSLSTDVVYGTGKVTEDEVVGFASESLNCLGAAARRTYFISRIGENLSHGIARILHPVRNQNFELSSVSGHIEVSSKQRRCQI